MKIFYHNSDLDGKCSAAIVCRKYPKATIVGYNYYYEHNRAFSGIQQNEELIFVDITPSVESLRVLLQTTPNITILDHHKTSISSLAEANLVFPGKLDDTGLGACKLVWEYYYPEHPLPKSVLWIAEHDVWKNTPTNKFFHFGLGLQNTYPTNPTWDKLFDDHHPIIEQVLEAGKIIQTYLVHWYKTLVKVYGIPGKIRHLGTYSAMVLNQGAVNSFVFDSVITQYDVFVRVVKGKDDGWRCSITTEKDDIDVSEIAKKFGGGGHKKAAGFRVDKLEDFFIQEGEK